MKAFTDAQMQQSARNAEPVRAETDKLKLDAANEKLAKIYDSKRRKRIQNNTPKERISTEGKEGLHSKGVPKSTIREKSFEWINDEVTGMLPNLLYHANGSRSKAVLIIRDLIRKVESEYGLDGFFSEIAEEFDPHVSASQCMVGNIKNRLASLADCYSDTARMQRDIIIASWYPDKDSKMIMKCLEAAGVTHGSQPQRRAKIASAKFDAVAARRRRPPQVGDPVLCHGVLVKLIQLPDAAFSKADEGKPIAIADGKVQIDGADRFVEWGGAVPKDCNAKIDTVDPQLQGAVILDTGRKLKNPADPTTGKKCIVEVTGEGLSAQPEFAHTGWSAGGARIHHTTLDLSSWQARTKPFSAEILAHMLCYACYVHTHAAVGGALCRVRHCRSLPDTHQHRVCCYCTRKEGACAWGLRDDSGRIALPIQRLLLWPRLPEILTTCACVSLLIKFCSRTKTPVLMVVHGGWLSLWMLLSTRTGLG